MRYLHWLHLGFALLSLVTGCNTIAQRGPELERARAAVAVAYAEINAGVTDWQGENPLIGTEVETDEPATESAAGDGADAEPTPPAKEIAPSADIDWQPFTLETVKAAREAGKPLVVHVSGDPKTCPHCVTAAKLLTDQSIVNRVNRQLVAVQVDIARGAGPAIASVYEVDHIPFDVFVFPSGKFLPYPGCPDGTGAYLHRLDSFGQFEDEARWPGYVSAASAGKWKLKGETVDASHLINHAKHRGKFNEAWLRSLSRNQLLTLHDHDHEPGDQVRWEFVPAGER